MRIKSERFEVAAKLRFAVCELVTRKVWGEKSGICENILKA